MYKINYLSQEKNNKLSFVFEASKQYFIGDKITLKIDGELYYAEVTNSNYSLHESEIEGVCLIGLYNYTATTILKIQKSFLNSSFSIIEFVNDEENRKLLRQQHEQSMYL